MGSFIMNAVKEVDIFLYGEGTGPEMGVWS
jgi:hypothetical protein